MCKVFQVSNSGFYYWLKHPKGKRIIEKDNLLNQIAKIYQDSKGRYRSPRITTEHRTYGVFVSRPRVARLMRELNLKIVVHKKYVQTTDSKHRYTVAENILNRNFLAANIAEKWVSA